MSTWKREEYFNIALEAVRTYGKELLKAEPKDGKEYGMDLYQDRASFYANLLGALAHFESGQNPETTYVENFKDAKGKFVVSRGILQLSIESANSYGAGIKKAEDLHKPEVNLKAGVLILSRWIVRHSVIAGGKRSAWRGGSMYWAVLRKAERIRQIQKLVKDAAK